MTMWKKFVWNLCKFIYIKKKKNHKYVSIHSLCSILCWSTFGTNYSLKSFWVWCYKLGTSIFGQFLFLLCRNSQAPSGWMWSVGAQQFSDLSRDVQSGSSLGSSWATQGHSQSCPWVSCVILAVCWGSLPQSKVQRMFSSRTFIFPSILMRLPVPAAEQHLHSWCCLQHALL